MAESRSSETFVALCLLTVVGASLITSSMGMSDTLGAFIAGVLLSETSFRTQVGAVCDEFRGLRSTPVFPTVTDPPTPPPKPPTANRQPPQVEADIRPFRGLLLGLFFVSVGSSIDTQVLMSHVDVVACMLAGLVGFKAAVNILLGPLFGLTR